LEKDYKLQPYDLILIEEATNLYTQFRAILNYRFSNRFSLQDQAARVHSENNLVNKFNKLNAKFSDLRKIFVLINPEKIVCNIINYLI
jgi:hypothetical protein